MPAADGRTISINIRAITGELTSGLKTASGATRAWAAETQGSIAQVEASTERISRLWRSAFEAFLGFEAVKALRGIALGAADAAEELAVAARVAQNFGHSLNTEQMESWLEAFAKSAKGGGYSVNQMRDSLQLFASLGLDSAQIMRAIADTASLAAAKNMDFAQATTVVRMALTGHVEMLTRYGVISREAAKNIKTVEQAMEALEKGTKGAAEERANSLIGAFGRMATAFQLLSDKFGASLEPFFDAIAKALTGLANALDAIPAPVMRFIGTLTALGVSLAATALILPAIAKGIAIMREGLMLVFAVIQPGIVLVGRLAATLGLATTGFEAFTAAELASMAPIAAIIAAIAGITVALVEMTNHMDHVKTAWADFCSYLSERFHQTAEDIKADADGIVRMMQALASMNVGNIKKAYATNIAVSKERMAEDQHGPAGKRFSGDISQIGKDIVGDWKRIATSIIGSFMGAGQGKAPTVPGEAFTGVIPGKTGKGKDTSAQQAENALKNFDEATKNWLAEFQARVDDAKAKVDISSEKLADFDVRHPADQAMSAKDQAERQKLVTAELKAQVNLRVQLLAQENAEKQVSSEYLAIAAKISPHLKNHDALVRQARDAAREHAKAAQDIYLSYLRAGTELDTIIAKEHAAAQAQSNQHFQGLIDANDMALDATKSAAASVQESLEQALSMAQMGSTSGVEFQGAPMTSSERNYRQQAMRTTTTHGRDTATVAEDRLKVALAELALSVAEADKQTKQKNKDDAEARYNAYKTQDNLNLLNSAQQALTQSTIGVAKANDDLIQAQRKLTLDIAEQWNTLMQGLIQKVGAPGLSGAGSATSPLSFNPMTFLFAAIENSQTFADVMNTATQIMNTFTQVINALRPVVDLLMDAVRAVVNVFIFLYNQLARILDLFGLQIQQLQYLTDAMSGLVPLISIVHEIPTLNELAAGRLNSPLSTTPQGYNNIGQTNGGQNTLMRVVEILTGIFAAIVIEKVISGVSLQHAIQQTLQLVGIHTGITTASATANANANSLRATTISTAAKQLSTTVNSNTLLSQILLTLQQIAATGMMGGGGDLGFVKSILGGSPIGGFGALGGIASLAKTLGPEGPIGSAARTLSNAFNATTRSLQQHTAALQQNVAALMSFGTALSGASQKLALIGTGPGGSSASLALDFSRRANGSSYPLDRPAQY